MTSTLRARLPGLTLLGAIFTLGLMLTISLGSTPAQAECYHNLDDAALSLNRRLDQTPWGLGIQKDTLGKDAALVLFLNRTNRHWTIVQLMSGNLYCVSATGRDWRVPTPGLPS